MIPSACLRCVSLCLAVSIVSRLVAGDPGLSDTVRKAAVDVFEKMRDAPLNILHPVNEEYRNSSIHMIHKFMNPEGDVLPDVRYQLFTRDEPKEVYNLQPTLKSIQDSSFDSKRETKFLIPSGYTNLPKSSVYYAMKYELLEEGNYNVIVVDWTKYNKGSEENVVAHVPIVGLKVAQLIQVLAGLVGITMESVHVIGHGFGAHIAAYIGRTTPLSPLGRISGLDATGPVYIDSPGLYRLSYTDAIFVDGLHTNGALIVDKGIGTLRPYGTLDFYPNGGRNQPGCNNGSYFDTEGRKHFADTPMKRHLCSHGRSVFLYLASISDCSFFSLFCYSYDDFKRRSCPFQVPEAPEMGFRAKPIPSLGERAKLYLDTAKIYPYC